MDDLPRQKLTRSQRKNRDVKTCAWVQLLKDKDLDDSTSITAKQFRGDFRIPYGLHCHERANLYLNQCVCPTIWFNQSVQSTDRQLCPRLLKLYQQRFLSRSRPDIDCVKTTTLCLARSRKNFTHLLVLRSIIGYRTRVGTLPFAGQGVG